MPEGQKFQLMILGGSGLYTYSLKKMIASVSPDGMIHTTKVGETELVVSDRKDPNNIVVIRLIVSEIVSAHSLEAKK